MTRNFYGVLAAAAWLGVATYLTAFVPAAVRGPSAAERVTARYQRDFDTLTSALEQLHHAARHLGHAPETRRALGQAYERVRDRFKRVEYLMEYLSPEVVKDYVNGPPLPKLMRNAPRLVVLAPQGLQVIDELLAEGAIDKKALVDEIAHLRSKLVALHAFEPHTVTDRQFFEAVRFGLVRIFTLGVTGFDTPGAAAQRALPDALASLRGMATGWEAYGSRLAARAPALARRIDSTHAEAIAYLKNHPDFDDFDRLHFLTAYVNPLFKAAVEAQQVLWVETVYEVMPGHVGLPTNYLADNLFAPDFLNVSYYTPVAGSAGLTAAVPALGKLLFFDPALSAGTERSCASCHRPDQAFTDGLARSVATDFKGTLLRNAPTLVNAVYADRFFYDLRVNALEDQFEHVLVSTQEFHSDYLSVAARLRRSPEYVALFREAFPREAAQPVSKQTIARALGAYVGSLTALHSPFDRYVRGEQDTIDAAVRRGFNLFMGKAACGTCHFAPLFNGTVPPFYVESESEVLGVPATPDTLRPVLDGDLGRYAGQEKERADMYRHSFKTVTVRNVALTAPYMHNGVYQTLEQVLDFYNRGGGAGLGLEVPHQTLAPDALNLTGNEQQDIIPFMRALTDTSGLTRLPDRLPAFSDTALNRRVVGGTY